MKNCVVVGGGLCGLFSAIILADKFENVYVIESDQSCGGLLKSVTDDAGVVYDQGTHIPNSTMIDEIDDILFGDEENRSKNWNTLGRLKTCLTIKPYQLRKKYKILLFFLHHNE